MPGPLVGLQLPVQAQSSIFVEPWEADAGPEALRDVSVAAEESGWGYVAVCDHTVVPAGAVERIGATWYEPLTTLAWLAAATSTIRLLTHVYVLPLHHPLHAAKAVSTLDCLSDGRVILGVGAGHVEEEFAALGVDRSARGRLLDEHLDALRVALDDDVASFDGPTVSFTDMVVAPRPVQSSVPIWVGGSSPAAQRRAGARGDGWLPQGTPLGEMPFAIDRIRETAEAAGRDPDLIAIGGLPLPMYVGDAPWDLGRHTTSGSPAALADHLTAWLDVGCQHLQVRLRSRSASELVDQVSRFGTEVLPLLPRPQPPGADG